MGSFPTVIQDPWPLSAGCGQEGRSCPKGRGGLAKRLLTECCLIRRSMARNRGNGATGKVKRRGPFDRGGGREGPTETVVSSSTRLFSRTAYHLKNAQRGTPRVVGVVHELAHFLRIEDLGSPRRIPWNRKKDEKDKLGIRVIKKKRAKTRMKKWSRHAQVRFSRRPAA